MTKGLIRYYGTRHLHFITCSCYRRQPQLHTARRRNLFLKVLEQARRKYPTFHPQSIPAFGLGC